MNSVSSAYHSDSSSTGVYNNNKGPIGPGGVPIHLMHDPHLHHYEAHQYKHTNYEDIQPAFDHHNIDPHEARRYHTYKSGGESMGDEDEKMNQNEQEHNSIHPSQHHDPSHSHHHHY
jgi:hypothetical protein